MNNPTYVTYHLHTELSLLDSCTNFKAYVDRAKELGQTAICFTEHGNTYNWIEKKMYCREQGIRFLYGVECYLTKCLYEETDDGKQNKIRDNYHTILIAKNYAGLQEINTLIDLSTQDDHFYYKPRITFDEFKGISENVIRISACLASPLAKLRDESLIPYYDYLEIQPHIHSSDQKEYNWWLYEMSVKYKKPLIAGTDTHSLDDYKAQCRSVLQSAKHIEFSNEDEFDLTYKSYDELVEMFRKQGALHESVYMEAIENTNRMADTVEDFELDTEFKYPKLYDDEEAVFKELINTMYKDKLERGVIRKDPRYIEQVREEMRVFRKIGMVGFMLFMSELVRWCWQNHIPIGYCRGSVGGSVIAYLTDIIDVDPIVWGTVFSRFSNEDRKEIGDIDIDISPSQRHLVYEHIIDQFGQDKTAYILAIGTISDKGTIDEIGRALADRWTKDKDAYIQTLRKILCDDKRITEIETSQVNPYALDTITAIKTAYEADTEETRKKYPDLFYYFDGLVNTAVSQSMHPAGIIVSPVTLPDNYGTFWRDGKRIMSINMEEVHEVSLVKYDLLGLKNIEVIKDCCSLAGIPYPKSHEINWNDTAVWKDMIRSPAGVFQFEGEYAFKMLKDFKPQKINDMSMVNAALRPSGASYRDKLLSREINKNPSEIIDDLLKDNLGYLIYQEDTIAFLQKICGLSGSEADNIRRAIGRKQKDRLDAAMPQILDGYCSMSPKPRETAEEEAKAFLQIIEDSSNYQFGYNHSTGYSMIGYTCAYMRYYYPEEFIASYLNNAGNDDDIRTGTELAAQKGIRIYPPKFGHSGASYTVDKKERAIYKGVESIKFLNGSVAESLYAMRDTHFDSFLDLLQVFPGNSRQREILIRLHFFDAFGKAGKLLKLAELYDAYADRKQIKKDSLPAEYINIFARHAEQTEKQFRKIDSIAVLKELEETVENTDIPLRQSLAAETEFLGYVQTTVPNLPEDCHLILSCTVRTKSITGVLYRLRDGKTYPVKIQKTTYKKKPFAATDIIRVGRMVKEGKWVMGADGSWQRDNNNMELVLKEWLVTKT